MPPAPKKKTAPKARVNPTRSSTRGKKGVDDSADTEAPSAPPRRSASKKGAQNPPPAAEEIETEVQDNEDVEDLAAAVAALKSNATEAQDVVDDIRTQLNQYGNDIVDLSTQVRSLVQALQASVPGINNAPSTIPSMTAAPLAHGTNPLSFIQKHLAWVDSNMVTSIVSLKLDPKELINLIPLDERPNKRGGQRSNLHIDTTTGLITTVDDTPTAFEKDFPTVEYLVYAFSVYGAIRGLYDIDNTGIGPAIFLHIKKFVREVAVAAYDWKSIVSYVIAHFRKHQKSSNPLDWVTHDSELFLQHMRPPASQVVAPRLPPLSRANQPQPSRLPRPKSEICINWNTFDKGCSWSTCTRDHICILCRSTDHKQYQCKKGRTPKADAVKGEKS